MQWRTQLMGSVRHDLIFRFVCGFSGFLGCAQLHLGLFFFFKGNLKFFCELHRLFEKRLTGFHSHQEITSAIVQRQITEFQPQGGHLFHRRNLGSSHKQPLCIELDDLTAEEQRRVRADTEVNDHPRQLNQLLYGLDTSGSDNDYNILKQAVRRQLRPESLETMRQPHKAKIFSNQEMKWTDDF